MRARGLPLALLVLLLGAGAAYLALQRESGGRGQGKDRPARLVRTTPEEPEPEISRVESSPAPRQVRDRLNALELPPERSVLEGSIIGDGAPLAGAELELVAADDPRAEPLGLARSDERGRFRLESAPLVRASVLRVHARGYVSLERPLPARGATGTVMLGNVRLLRGQRIEGRVVDGRGRGVADVELRAEPTNPGSDVPFAAARSQVDGAFELADAPPGTVLVHARAPGYADQSVRFTPGTTPFEIRLEPGATLRVAVRGPRGVAVVGAEVAVQPQDNLRGPKRVKTSDAEGVAVFEGLGSTLWSARITHPDFRPAGGSRLEANGREQLVECLPWPAIEGVVRAPGGAPPPPGTRVHALPAATPGDRIAELAGGVEVAADGFFRLGGLRAGDWRVRASAPGFAPASSNLVRLGIEGDGFAGSFELAPGRTLELVLTRDGAPLAAAELELFPDEPTPAQVWALAEARAGELGRRALSNAEGHASFASLPGGRVWIAVYAEGSPPTRSGPHEVGGPSAAPPIEIALARGARVAGRVLTKTGKPEAGAQLRLVEDGLQLAFPLTLASDDDGRYTSAWLPPGRYTLEAFASDDPTRRSGASEFELAAGEERSLDLSL
jgi:hypothetical protein